MHAQSLDYGAFQETFGEPVTVSATGKPQRASDVPADMEIITADEIRRSGAATIPDILASYAGVTVRRNALGSADVGIRGYNGGQNPRLLVLLNGRQVYFDNAGYTDWNSLPVQLNEIRQIELIRGPNAALFGFNAVGGVVNIVTFQPLYDTALVAEGTAGSQYYTEGSAVANGKISDNFGLRLSAGGYSARDFRDPGALLPLGNAGNRLFSTSELPLQTQPGNARFAIDARGFVAPGVEVGLEATLTNSNSMQMTQFNYYEKTRVQTNSVKGDVAAETPVGSASLNVYSNQASLFSELPDNLLPGNPSFDTDQQVTVVQLGDLFKIGPFHTVRLSGEYRHNALNTTPTGGATLSYDVYSTAAMWDWQVAPTVSWNNAMRYDDLHLDRSGAILPGLGLTNDDFRRTIDAATWNSGMVWWATDTNAVTATAARGMQLPSLYNFGGLYAEDPLGHGQYAVLSGIPTVKPGITDNYELSLTHDALPLEAHIKAAVFYQQNHAVINAAPANTYILVTPTTHVQTIFLNNGDSDAVGFEFSAKGKVGPLWHWSAAYSLIDITMDPRFRGHALAGRTGYFDFANETPANIANLGLGYAQGPWEIDGHVRYTDSFTALKSTAVGAAYMAETVPHSFDLSLRVAYALTEVLTLAGSGDQVNAEKQTTLFGLPTERRLYGTITARY